LELTLALDRNDRTLALHLGIVGLPEGVRLSYVPQAGEHGRHERMLGSLEWDLCELSLSSYIIARAQGHPLRAIPIFPRRMFTPGLVFVREDAGIRSPADLSSKRFGIRTFQTTLSVWGLGDLATVYGVPLEGVEWVTQAEEALAVQVPADRKWRRLPAGDSLNQALARGELDAVLVPWIPSAAREGRAHRLFSDPIAEHRRYLETTGVFPIMHTIVGKEEVLQEDPALIRGLMRSFEESKRAGLGFYDDPAWSTLAGTHAMLDEQQGWLGEDPFPYGVPPNRIALERLMGYQAMLGLIREPLPLEDLFIEPKDGGDT
jgi:4,5-dihydroxyphthalate decarboxylase